MDDACVDRDGNRDEVSGLFMVTSRTTLASTVTGSIVGLVEPGSSLRRVTSLRRTFTSGAAAVKRRSIGVQIKFQMVSNTSSMSSNHMTSLHSSVVTVYVSGIAS